MLEQYDEHRLGNSVAVAARIIYRLSKLVPDNMDRSGLFSFFSKELRASFHYDRFSIFLYDAERDFLTAFTAADGTVVEVFSDTRIAQNTVAWQAIQTRKPVVIKNLASLNWGGAVSLASVGLPPPLPCRSFSTVRSSVRCTSHLCASLIIWWKF